MSNTTSTELVVFRRVYSLIEEDLKEAIPNLPVVQSEVYKVSKGAAQALLGKVYLYHGTFDA